jgi:hypothetical protein
VTTRVVVAELDMITLHSALADAIAHQGAKIGRCRGCFPGRACTLHKPAEMAIARYRDLETRIREAPA